MTGKPHENLRLWRLWYSKYRFHSVFVHFPLALIPYALLSQLLFLFTGRVFFFNTAFFAQILSLISMVFAMGTGILSWMINYDQSVDSRFRVKISCSILLVIITSAEIILSIPLVMLQAVNQISAASFNVAADIFLTFIGCILVAAIGRAGKKLTWTV